MKVDGNGENKNKESEIIGVVGGGRDRRIVCGKREVVGKIDQEF